MTSSFTDFTPWPRRQNTPEQNSYTYLSVAHELKWITPTVKDIRTSTTLFVMLMDAMYKLHHRKRNDILWGIAQNYFADKW